MVFSEPDTQALAGGVVCGGVAGGGTPELGWVGHVGDDFCEDAVNVLQGRVGDPAWAADEVPRGIEIASSSREWQRQAKQTKVTSRGVMGGSALAFLCEHVFLAGISAVHIPCA